MKHLKSSIIFVLLLVLGVAFVGCNATSQEDYNLKNVSNAYITLDINPSIEIITNEEGLVEQVNGLNDDAIRLLVDQDFTGQTVDVTLDAILNLAIEFGYIDFELENAVLVTTGAETEEETEELEINVSEKVKAFIEGRKMKVEVVKASIEATEDIKAVAEQYGISIGKVKIITYAMAMDSELTIEAAAEMSIRDLTRIIKEGRNEIKEFYSEEVRGEYFRIKEQLKDNFKVSVASLYNQKIQAASVEVFASLLVDTEVTAEQIKALYQEYYDALLNVELEETPATDEVIEEETPAVDVNVTVRLEELKNLRDELSLELKDLMNQMKSQDDNELTQEEIDQILARIKEVVLERTEVTVEYNKLRASVAIEKGHNNIVDKIKDRFGLGKGQNGDKGQVDLADLLKSVKIEFVQKFEELGIELEQVELLFKAEVEVEIEAMMEANNAELEKARNQFIADSKALRDQIIQENEILRKAWDR